MFSRNHPYRQPFNARNSRFSEKATDQSLSLVPFGNAYSPVLWATRYGHLDMWPATAHMMAHLGIHPEHTWYALLHLNMWTAKKN